MPPGLRKLVKIYYLHDAIVRGMGQSSNAFLNFLQLDTPPQSLLTLTYDLLAEPAFHPDALPLPFRVRGRQVDWQHDEIEREAGELLTWRQSILLSNGREVSHRFRDRAGSNGLDPCAREWRGFATLSPVSQAFKPIPLGNALQRLRNNRSTFGCLPLISPD